MSETAQTTTQLTGPLARSEQAEPAPAPAEVNMLAAWMWATAQRASGVQIEAHEVMPRWSAGSVALQGFWRAHARGYLVDRARRSRE